MKDTSRRLQNLEDSNHIQILLKLENLKLNLLKPSWLTAKFPVRLSSGERRDNICPLASFDANGERKRCLS